MVKQLEHHSKPGKTILGMMLMWKRSQTCIPPSQTGHNQQQWYICNSVVKSKAEIPWSYVVQTPQGEYRRNMIQLKESAIPIRVPVSASTTTSTTVQPTSVPLYTKDVIAKPLCPTRETPDNNKENANVSAEHTPDPQYERYEKKLKFGT